MADMRDVAREAGVSLSTVSHVLNKTRYVSPELQERVREAASRLNYRHNALARSLRTKRSNTIGLVIPDVTNPYYPALAQGVLRTADANGNVTVLCNSDRDPQKEIEIMQVLERRQVDGIIFNPSGNYPEQVEALRALRVPIVLLGSRLASEDFDVVLTNPRGAYEPVTYLISLGHRRIGLIGGRRSNTPRPGKYTGYLAALVDAGIPAEDELTTEGNYTVDSGYERARQLLALSNPPTAIFAANDLMAIGALIAVREAGLRIPEDFSVVGFDNIPQASITTPRLTTVAVPKYEMGEAAAKLLLKRIGGDDSPRQSVVLPHRLVVRESSGPAPRRRPVAGGVVVTTPDEGGPGEPGR